MTELDLNRLRTLIYKETGMLFEDKKDYYLTARVQQRMTKTGARTFTEYYHSMVFSPEKGELQNFIEAITINETYFFRDFPQLQGFAEKVLPPYLDSKRDKQNLQLRIWSAACSTGEEAYTLSIILREMIDSYQSWKVEIQATDLDREVLAHAQAGIYGERSMKDTPTIYKNKYFSQKGAEWEVNDSAREFLKFSPLNFMDRLAMRAMQGFDFVFCRNVLIYFDDESRKKVVNSLYDSLVPGGYLFLGHAESIGRITGAFELQNIQGFLCYRRPL